MKGLRLFSLLSSSFPPSMYNSVNHFILIHCLHFVIYNLKLDVNANDCLVNAFILDNNKTSHIMMEKGK